MHPVFCPPVHPHNPRFVVTSPAPQLGREYPFFQRHIIQIILVDDRTVAADPDPHHYAIKSTPKVKLQVKRGVSGGGYGCCLPWLERNILRRRFVPGRLTRTHSLQQRGRRSKRCPLCCPIHSFGGAPLMIRGRNLKRCLVYAA